MVGGLAVPAIEHSVAVSCGQDIALVIKPDGTVQQWNLPGVQPPPPGLTDAIAISAGDGRAIALRSDGSVVTWGADVDTVPPAGMGTVVEVKANRNTGFAAHNAAGRVFTWPGENPAASETEALGIAAGGDTENL